MQLITRYRIPALLCVLAVLLCALLAHPVANSRFIELARY